MFPFLDIYLQILILQHIDIKWSFFWFPVGYAGAFYFLLFYSSFSWWVISWEVCFFSVTKSPLFLCSTTTRGFCRQWFSEILTRQCCLCVQKQQFLCISAAWAPLLFSTRKYRGVYGGIEKCGKCGFGSG